MHVDIGIMAFVDVWLIGANGKKLAGQGGAVLQMMAVGNAGGEAGDVARTEQGFDVFLDQHRLADQHYHHFVLMRVPVPLAGPGAGLECHQIGTELTQAASRRHRAP